MAKCYELPSGYFIWRVFSRGLLQITPCSRQQQAPRSFSVMFSLLGRKARRSHGIHAFGRSVTNSALQYLEVPRNSRGLNASCPEISYCHESPDKGVIAVNGVRAHGGVALATCGSWEARRSSNPRKWEGLVSMKVSETLAGGFLSRPQQNELSLTLLV